MIMAVDVQYAEEGTARVAAVLFEQWTDSTPRHEFTIECSNIAEYEPGKFYLRELPCILAILEVIPDALSGIVVDGHVDLGERGPGLGRHLYDALDGQIPVIGVAKSFFPDTGAIEVQRGNSRRPLYVSSAGIPASEIALGVGRMHGKYRFPTLLKRVDSLARGRP